MSSKIKLRGLVIFEIGYENLTLHPPVYKPCDRESVVPVCKAAKELLWLVGKRAHASSWWCESDCALFLDFTSLPIDTTPDPYSVLENKLQTLCVPVVVFADWFPKVTFCLHGYKLTIQESH